MNEAKTGLYCALLLRASLLGRSQEEVKCQQVAARSPRVMQGVRSCHFWTNGGTARMSGTATVYQEDGNA